MPGEVAFARECLETRFASPLEIYQVPFESASAIAHHRVGSHDKFRSNV